MTSLSLMLVLFAADADAGSSWAGFRNDGRSIATGRPPLQEWSPESGIAWTRDLPGYGQSAPVVRDGVIYVTTVVGPQKEQCVVLAMDARTGETRWEHTLEASATAPSNYAVARAAPTPVVHADGIHAFFESGDLVALSLDGRVRWQRSLTKEFGEFRNHHGIGGSPVLADGNLYLNVQHDGPSYLIAIDATSGKTAWKVDRPSAKSWTTPVMVEAGDSSQLVVSSAGSVTGHDPRTGERLWQLEGVGGNTIPSPTAIGNRVYVGASVSDFDTPENAARSNVCLEVVPDRESGYQFVWRAERAFAHYASPLVHRGCAYYVNSTGVVYCLNAETGERNYVERLGAACWATPVAIGDAVYFFGKDGRTHVVAAGSEFQRLATNDLWDRADPPKPESYVETPSSHSGGGGGRGGFAAMLLRNDANGDGHVSSDEMPKSMKAMLTRGDSNGDGQLDPTEIEAMSVAFRKRREHARGDSRDPILYGVAVADGTIFLRTGTRMYCVRADE